MIFPFNPKKKERYIFNEKNSGNHYLLIMKVTKQKRNVEYR